MFGDLVSQRRRNDAADHFCALGQVATGGTGLQNVLHQHAAQLVTGQLTEAALAVRNGDSDAVCIRVSAQDHITGSSLGHLIALIQGGVGLGVGVLTGLEIAVRLFLAGNNSDIYAQAAQDLTNRLVAGAAQRGLDFNRGRWLNTLLHRKAQAMRLTLTMVRVLTQYYRLDIAVGCILQRIENIVHIWENSSCFIFFCKKCTQFKIVFLLKLTPKQFIPFVSYVNHYLTPLRQKLWLLFFTCLISCVFSNRGIST